MLSFTSSSSVSVLSFTSTTVPSPAPSSSVSVLSFTSSSSVSVLSFTSTTVPSPAPSSSVFVPSSAFTSGASFPICTGPYASSNSSRNFPISPQISVLLLHFITSIRLFSSNCSSFVKLMIVPSISSPPVDFTNFPRILFICCHLPLPLLLYIL